MRDASAACHDLPVVARDPRALGYWLVSARRAQVALAGVVLFGLLAMPPARDAVLSWVLPKKTTSHFFGLATRTHEHPTFRPARVWVTRVYWAGGAVFVALALWLHLPRARRWAEVAHEADAGGGGPQDRREVSPTVRRTPAAPVAGDEPTVATDRLVAGRYRPLEELGRGGMGVVYRAHDEVLGRDVALKALPAELVEHVEIEQRFRQEARALAQLTHPHIVQVFDLVVEGAERWIAMELVDGGSVADLLESGPVPLPQLLPLASQMADALAYSHERGVIHRDFKPANVLLTRRRAVKVTDFGLAKLIHRDSGLTQVGVVMGSPSYMSPEQAAGQPVGPVSDIYSFGITLYELATGRVPFGGELQQILVKHISQPPQPLRELVGEIPEPFEAMVMAMLAKQPSERPATVPDAVRLLDELAPAVRGTGA